MYFLKIPHCGAAHACCPNRDASIYLSRFGGAFQASNKALTEIVNERLGMPEEERPVSSICGQSLNH
jgi:hypothetical protein